MILKFFETFWQQCITLTSVFAEVSRWPLVLSVAYSSMNIHEDEVVMSGLDMSSVTWPWPLSESMSDEAPIRSVSPEGSMGSVIHQILKLLNAAKDGNRVYKDV